MSSWALKLPIKKSDSEQGLATGWASVVTTANGDPIVDHDGDIILIEDLEKAVMDAFVDGGRGRAGEMHETMNQADIVESFVLTQEKRRALGLGDGPEGWIVTLKVHDPELRKKIKSGEMSELSLAGEAEKVAI